MYCNFLIERLRPIFCLGSIVVTSLSAVAVGSETKEDTPFLHSVCPSGLSPYLNKKIVEGEHLLFQQWRGILQNFNPILKEGGSPSIFISHAWHEAYYTRQGSDRTLLEEARYYDQIDLYLARALTDAGFEVFYDKDLHSGNGIMDQGSTTFMEEKVSNADVILSVCTPLYHERSSYPSGVQTEVEYIKARLESSPTIGFYIPLLVHASDKMCDTSHLRVGQDLERMTQVIYLDWRDQSTFMSNMWRLCHRLWKNIRLKWEDNPTYDSQTSPLNQRYVNVLGDLLQIEDYYDHNGHPISAESKELLRSDYLNLRVLTTLSEDMNASTIADLVTKEIEAHAELLNVSRGRDIVALLGNTGTGKSTLVNFLSGKTLRPDEHRQGYVLVNPSEMGAMKIGSGADSETVFPECAKIGDLLCFDFPGFNDTSGSIRD